MWHVVCAGGNGAESSAAHTLFVRAASQVLSMLQNQMPQTDQDAAQASKNPLHVVVRHEKVIL